VQEESIRTRYYYHYENRYGTPTKTIITALHESNRPTKQDGEVTHQDINNFGHFLSFHVSVLLLLSFLPRDASAERGDATVSCPSVRQ